MNQDYELGALYIPIIGARTIRSKLIFAIICVLAIMSEVGLVYSPVTHLYSKLLYSTMIISPSTAERKAPQGSEVEIKNTWNDEGGEVVLKFPDGEFELQYTTNDADGMLPFSVEKLQTTFKGGKNEQQHRHNGCTEASDGQVSCGGEG